MFQESPVEHLYVHVPFCAKKCDYCAFYSESSSGPLTDRYVDALLVELQIAAPDLRPKTIFFGGGTPSLLTLAQWERLLQAIRRLGWTSVAEWTVECNPATVSLDKARLLRDGGVNRISMGAQSFDEMLLDRLGRVHSRQMIFKSFDILRAAGFDNVNVDLMFAIPGQTLASWRQTLAEAMALGSEHLSCYEVIYEEDTPLFEQLKAGAVQVDEDLACAMYDELLLAVGRRGISTVPKWPISPAIRGRLRPMCPTAPAAIMSTIGVAVPFTGWAPAPPGMSAVLARGIAPIPSSIAINWSAAGAPSKQRRNCRRWPAPAKSPPSVCA